jgi:hypothetical protein
MVEQDDARAQAIEDILCLTVGGPAVVDRVAA